MTKLKPRRLLKRLFRTLVEPLLRWFVLRLNSHTSRILQDELFKKLKAHGKNCTIQWPIQVTGHPCVELGDDVSIASYVHMWGEGGIKIGSRVMIASHAAITSLTHDYSQLYMYNTIIKGQVTIEDDVWIGAHSVILPGITLGCGAVIGAGSIVTKDVLPFAIVTGEPARVLKFRNAQEPESD